MRKIETIPFIGVLSGVSKEATLGILSSCKIREYKKGKEIIAYNQENKILYFVLAGEIGVEFGSKKKSAEAIHLFRGETVGEMSVIDGSPTSARVFAVSKSILVEIKYSDFWRLIKASHQFSMNMLQQLSRRVRDDDTLIKESKNEINHLLSYSLQDPMTSLYNRRWLSDNGARIINRFKISKDPISFLMIDIDHFKNVNDKFGHLIGDDILERVALIIKQLIRPTDFAVRYGGEEFLIFLTSTSDEEAKIPAERIRERIEQETRLEAVEGIKPPVTISCGISTLSNSDDTIEEIISRADKKMYQAKESGRNRVIL